MRIELYLQAYAQAGSHQTRVVESLKRLRGAGVIRGLGIQYWPSKTRFGEFGDETVNGVYSRFREWADRHGCSLPAFRVVRRTCGFTGETGMVLQTPVACVAVYEDDELREVYPRMEEGEHRSVTGFLTDLEDRLKDPIDRAQASP